MFRLAAAVCFLLTSQTMADQICQPPKSESTFYLTNLMSDFYVATDFELNKIIGVFSGNGMDGVWFLGDMNTNYLYVNTSAGCKYIQYTDEQSSLFYQCLPASAKLQRSGLVDFYTLEAPTLTWLVGMEPVPDTEYYYKHFSRFIIDNVISDQSTYGVVYDFNLGISDPTVFDKDLSTCVEAPLDKLS